MLAKLALKMIKIDFHRKKFDAGKFLIPKSQLLSRKKETNKSKNKPNLAKKKNFEKLLFTQGSARKDFRALGERS